MSEYGGDWEPLGSRTLGDILGWTIIISPFVLLLASVYLLLTRGLNIAPLFGSPTPPPTSQPIVLPDYFIEYLVIVAAEISVLVIASVFNFLRRKEENRKLVEALNSQTQAISALVDAIRSERDARSVSSESSQESSQGTASSSPSQAESPSPPS